MQPENEEKKEQEKRTRAEWLLLLLSIIIIILLLLIFLGVGVSYYKLQKNDIFRIRGNVIYFDPWGSPDEDATFTEEMTNIIDDIDTLPSIEDIKGINDLNEIRALIEKILSILSRAQNLPENEKRYFDAVYRDRLERLLEALREKERQLIAENMRLEPYGEDGTRDSADGQNARKKEEQKKKEQKKKDNPPLNTHYEITIKDENGHTPEEDGFGKFRIDLDGLLYPGDVRIREYTLEISYIGKNRELHISIPDTGAGFHEEKSRLAEKLKCTVAIDGNEMTGTLGGMHAVYALPDAERQTTIKKNCRIKIEVPKDFNDDFSQAEEGSYQGLGIDKFTIELEMKQRQMPEGA